MKIASIQMSVGDESKAERLDRAENLLQQAKGADLVIFPEIWNVGYFCFDRYESESEPIDGLTFQRLSSAARQHGFYLHMGSFVESRGGKFYNTSLLINRHGKPIATYRKIHLFGYGSKESQILSRGSEVVVVDTELGKMGMSTCYDLRFPELFRKMTDRGTELFLIASGWPYPRLEHWLMFNRIRAIENTAFLASSNCVGVNRGARFCGHSMIVDPWGVIVSSGGDEECIVRAEIDMNRVSAIRKEFPALNDRVL
jgi:predicted amidohydrolase